MELHVQKWDRSKTPSPDLTTLFLFPMWEMSRDSGAIPEGRLLIPYGNHMNTTEIT